MSGAERSSSGSGAGPSGDTTGGRVQSTSTSSAAAGPSNARPIAPIPAGRAAGQSSWNPLRAAAPATPVVAGRGNAMVQNSGGSAGGARVVKPGQVNAAMAAKDAAKPGGAVNRPATGSIIVNSRQKGNPIIAHIKNVAWELGDIVPDYQLGGTTGLLFLSLRYHQLHSEYIHGRIEAMGQSYTLRLMMVMCDVENHQASIRELSKICIVMGYTMIVAWSAQEAGTYLEIYKAYERKPPDMIKARVDNDHMSILTASLTSVTGINKTDVNTLATNFGSFKNIVTASAESLSACVGIGETKVRRLRNACTGAFIVRAGAKKQKKSVAQAEGEKGPALN